MTATPEIAAWLNHVFPPPEAARLRAVPPFSDAPSANADGPAAQSPERVARVLEEANVELAQRQIGLRFIQAEGVPRPIVQVVDQTTGDILRQIPNEDAVRIAQALTGLLVDGRA